MASFINTLASLAEALIGWFVGLGFGWGWAILATTLALRVLVSPFAYKQLVTVSLFRKLSEEVKKIRTHYGEDVGGMTDAMQVLYQKNKFHPVNFILPALVQAPFFASIFFYLNSKEFTRDIGGERGFLFVQDLTQSTASHIPSFLGLVSIYLGVQIGSLLLQNKGRPDKKAWMFGLGLPALITLILVNFPAALMLYWTAGMVGLLIQQLIMKAFLTDPVIIPWEELEDGEEDASLDQVLGAELTSQAKSDRHSQGDVEVVAPRKEDPRRKKKKHGRNR